MLAFFPNSWDQLFVVCASPPRCNTTTTTTIYFIFLQRHFPLQLLMFAHFLSSCLHSPLYSFEILIEPLFNSFHISIIINAGGLFWGHSELILTQMLVGVGLFNQAGCAVLLCSVCSALILSSGLSFLFLELLLVEEDVEAALSEVKCVFCLCLLFYSHFSFFALISQVCSTFSFVSAHWLLYCHHSRNKCLFSIFISALYLFVFLSPNFLSCVSQTRTPRVTRLSPTQPALADQASRVSFASAENLETMSEPDIPIGFNRMNRLRQSLPLARSSSQAKLRAPGQTTVFIIYCSPNHTDCCWHVTLIQWFISNNSVFFCSRLFD